MLSIDDAEECLERFAQQYLSRSYDELAELADGQAADIDTGFFFEDCKAQEVGIDVAIGRLGRLRKRICVELTLIVDEWERWPRVPCIYFERYASGKLNRLSAGIITIMFIRLMMVLGLVAFSVAVIRAIHWVALQWIGR